MIGDAFKLLREVDLSHIATQAEARFTVFVVGPPDWSSAIGAALGQTACASMVHPWVVPLSSAPNGTTGDCGAVLAIVAVPGEAASEEVRQSLARLGSMRATIVGAQLLDDDIALAPAVEPPGCAAVVTIPGSTPPPAAVERLAPALLASAAKAQAGLDLALARRLPALRRPYVGDLIETVARANGMYAATAGAAAYIPLLGLPIAASDMLILTKNQIIMAYRIVLAAGMSGDPKDLLGEIVGVVGGGFLFRQVARELVAFVPIVGLPINTAIAYAGTRAVGEAMRQWAIEGRRVTPRDVNAAYRSALAGAQAVGRSLRGARTSRRRARGRPPAKPPEEPPAVAAPPGAPAI